MTIIKLNIFRTFFLFLTVSFLFLLSCQNHSANKIQVIPDAFEQNKHLGGGANIGSILYRWDNWDTNREMEELDLLKDLGMKGVRINTRPYLHASVDKSFTLSKKFYDRLDWLVNEALKRDFTVIIDQHQYRVMGKDPMGLKDIYLSTWRQMAQHYKNYPDNVYFGLLNEPNNNLTPYLWNFFLMEAYEIIRETNPTRTLVIGPGNWNKIAELENLELPEKDRNIIVEIHFYNPHSFTHQGVDGRDTMVAWLGTPDEVKAVEDEFNMAAEWGKRNNRPLYLGEFGVNYKADPESAARWFRCAREQMEKHKMSWALWDFMGSSFGIYNSEEKNWIVSRKEAILLE